MVMKCLQETQKTPLYLVTRGGMLNLILWSLSCGKRQRRSTEKIPVHATVRPYRRDDWATEGFEVQGRRRKHEVE